MKTELSMIAEELEAACKEMEAAAEKLAKYDYVGNVIDFSVVKTASDVCDAIDALAKHVVVMDIEDAQSIANELCNALTNARWSVFREEEAKAAEEADDLPPVLFSVGQIADIRK